MGGCGGIGLDLAGCQRGAPPLPADPGPAAQAGRDRLPSDPAGPPYRLVMTAILVTPRTYLAPGQGRVINGGVSLPLQARSRTAAPHAALIQIYPDMIEFGSAAVIQGAHPGRPKSDGWRAVGWCSSAASESVADGRERQSAGQSSDRTAPNTSPSAALGRKKGRRPMLAAANRLEQ